jgi:hypothetical protein
MLGSFDFFPGELIIHIALFLPLKYIVDLCLTNSKFNKIIFDDEYFWKQKCYQDFGVKIGNHREDWKNLYRNHINHPNIHVFGTNEDGQLGLGNFEHRNIPTEISGIKIRSITAGHLHTAVIDLNDNVWLFGFNYSGQSRYGRAARSR